MLNSQMQLSQYDRYQTQRPKEFKECRPFQIYQSSLGFPRQPAAVQIPWLVDLKRRKLSALHWTNWCPFTRVGNFILYAFCPSLPLCNVDKTLWSKGGMGVLALIHWVLRLWVHVYAIFQHNPSTFVALTLSLLPNHWILIICKLIINIYYLVFAITVQL